MGRERIQGSMNPNPNACSNACSDAHSKVAFRCRIPMSHFKVAFRYRIPISHSDVAFRCRIPKSHSEVAFPSLNLISILPTNVLKRLRLREKTNLKPNLKKKKFENFFF